MIDISGLMRENPCLHRIGALTSKELPTNDFASPMWWKVYRMLRGLDLRNIHKAITHGLER